MIERKNETEKMKERKKIMIKPGKRRRGIIMLRISYIGKKAQMIQTHEHSVCLCLFTVYREYIDRQRHR